jgi:hypothetical protein
MPDRPTFRVALKALRDEYDIYCKSCAFFDPYNSISTWGHCSLNWEGTASNNWCVSHQIEMA